MIEEEDKDSYLNDFQEKVNEFFAKRKIIVREYFSTCAETNEKYTGYNDNAAKMMLQIATEN